MNSIIVELDQYHTDDQSVCHFKLHLCCQLLINSAAARNVLLGDYSPGQKSPRGWGRALGDIVYRF